MAAFDLEEAIASWKRSLNKQQGLEPGLIEEIESNLRDRIDDMLEEGMEEAAAFDAAVEKTMPQPEVLATEYHKAQSLNNRKPPWERKPGLFSKAPMHFKVAIRNLRKRKAYAVLNVMGLAISISLSFLIALYVQDQRSYDRHFANADRIYRVLYDNVIEGETDAIPQADVGQPVGPTLVADYPEVVDVGRIRRIGQVTKLVTEKLEMNTEDIFVADERFLEVFQTPFIAGDPDTALDEPNTIVITASLALQLFERVDVVGQTITYSSVMPPMEVKITGVMKDHEHNTHMPYQGMVSYSTYFHESDLSNWLRKSYTFIVLNEQNDIGALEAKMPEFKRKYLDAPFEKFSIDANLAFQPLTDIYLGEEDLGSPYPRGNKANVITLTAIMVFLLIMACINYVNLATARAMDRAREVGIKKTLGALRSTLVFQFLAESVLLALVSGLIAILLAALILPYYTAYTGLELSLSDFLSLKNLLSMLGLALGIGLLAGFYPAFYLTAFKPEATLKGQVAAGRKGGLLRKSLIIVQYTLSSALITGIIIVASQISYIKHRDVGYDRENLLQIAAPDAPEDLKKLDGFLDRVRLLPTVRGASMSENVMHSHRGGGAQKMQSPDGAPQVTDMSYIRVGHDFFKSIGVEVVIGRDFIQSMSNEKAIIINETAAKTYGWEGRELEVKWLNHYHGKQYSPAQVVGVVKDFTLGESYHPDKPMMIYFDGWAGTDSNLFIGVSSKEMGQTIADIEGIWKEVFAGVDMNVEFVSDKILALYRAENIFLNLLAILGTVIVFVTVLGIIGLISFTTDIRKKEIAIRKISGAQIASILRLLSKQFFTMLLIATLFAIPLSYYVTNSWLSAYAKRIEPSFWLYGLSLPLCILLTLLTIAYHALKAAKANPVEALRYE